MKNIVVRIAVWLLILFLAWMALVSWSYTAPRIVPSLVIGWWGFLERVLPAMAVSWSGIGMAVGCSLLIIVGMHSLSGWLFAHASRILKEDSQRTWRWTWTIALYLGVWLVFFAIMGAVGVIHQVGWLVRSKEPLMVSQEFRGSLFEQLKRHENELLVAADESNWNLEESRRAFLQMTEWRAGRPGTVEDFHIVLLPGTNAQMVAGIIFHRDSGTRNRVGFVLVTPPAESEFLAIAKLPAVLARYQSQGVANTNVVRK